jgi:hypothetical protein
LQIDCVVKISYGFFLVATPLQILVACDEEPVLLNPDIVFTEEERMQICKQAIKMFPDRRIKFYKNVRITKSRTYRLNMETGRSEFVKAFACPTVPELFVQVAAEKEENRFTIWIIIREDEPLDRSD